MGAGGNWLQDNYSQNGGTTWGDIFMLNIDDGDPMAALRDAIRGGKAVYDDGHGGDRSRPPRPRPAAAPRGAALPPVGRRGLRRLPRVVRLGALTGGNETEEDAGLGDGGYR